MWEKPYIQKVLIELERLGYINANDFAREIDELHKAVANPLKFENDPTSVYVGHIKNRIKRDKPYSECIL